MAYVKTTFNGRSFASIHGEGYKLEPIIACIHFDLHVSANEIKFFPHLIAPWRSPSAAEASSTRGSKRKIRV